MSQYKKLFEPWMIGKVRIRNRIISAPMERNYCNIDGSVTQQYIDNLTAKAKGGVGLIMVESTYVDPRGKGRFYQLGCYDDRLIPGLKRLTDAVHQHGAKIALELQFSGRQTSGKVTGMQPMAPSPVSCAISGGDIPREMTIDEIKEMVVSFAQAAARSKQAGFDLVELHGAHGYLIAQFLSGYANKRTDAYGGSFENRMRFPLEVVAAVREAVGPDFPIAYRLSGDEYIDGGLSLEETVPFAQRLEQAGVDLIDVSAGLYETTYIISQPMDIPLGCNVPLAEEIKAAVDIPISVAGRINDPTFADDILAKGKSDFISFARALHADPEFPRKAQEGRSEDICMCIGCMQGCIDILGTGAPIFCAVNSSVGKEGPYEIKSAPRKKKVMVIGGGPGGMEAARIAALRGHDVSLYEKEDVLGGQVRWAAKPPFRGEYEQVIRYLSHQIKKAGVAVHLCQEVDRGNVYENKPDVVIVATGAYPYKGNFPGRDKPNVCTYLDILSGRVEPGKKVAVIGGDKIACEVAEFIVEKGSEVVLADSNDAFCQDCGQKIRWMIMERLESEERVEMRSRTTLEKIEDTSITLQKDGAKEQIDGIDTVVLCVGKVTENGLADQLKADATISELYMVGDCIRPRKITEAIAEGAAVGHCI